MSVHFVQDFVNVVNRTTRPLEVRYDGQTGIIPPYPARTPMSKIAADRAIVQNRIPGTENPYDPTDFQSYVGVVEWQNVAPIDPIEISEPGEALDRSQLPPHLQNVTLVRHGRPKVERSTISDPEGMVFENPAGSR
jgi:hypothetical protein